MSTVVEPHDTPDDLLTVPEGKWCELIDGSLVDKPSGALHGWVGNQIRSAIANYVDGHGLGYVFGPLAGYVSLTRDNMQVIKPDGSFVPMGRLSEEIIPKGHINVLPELVLEVISPNDSYYEVDAKVHLYQEAGIRLIWVINPDNRTVKVYAADRGAPLELTVGEELDGGEVLPGFGCLVTELFPG